MTDGFQVVTTSMPRPRPTDRRSDPAAIDVPQDVEVNAL